MSTELSNTTKRNIRAVAKKRAKAIAKKAMKGNKAAKLRALKLREQALKLRQQALKAEKEAKLRALKLEQAALKAKRDVEHAARVAAATAQRIAQQIAYRSLQGLFNHGASCRQDRSHDSGTDKKRTGQSVKNAPGPKSSTPSHCHHQTTAS